MDIKQYIISLPSCITYITNKEYRAQIRHVFRFDPNERFTYDGTLTAFSELDQKTQDELMFDNKTLSASMDVIFNDTNEESYFHDLYVCAAGQMLSTDPKIGQAVLCSFDTFHLYFACIWYFYVGGISGLLLCAEHRKLKSYFNL